jgi:hypothetical protein
MIESRGEILTRITGGKLIYRLPEMLIIAATGSKRVEPVSKHSTIFPITSIYSEPLEKFPES